MLRVYGRKGVMICTGGYAQNEEMMRDMNPYAVKHCTTMEGRASRAWRRFRRPTGESGAG